MSLRGVCVWASFCLNFAFLGVTAFLAASCLPSFLALRAAQRDAGRAGMDAYMVKRPFALYVAKRFPQDESYALVHSGGPELVIVEDERTTEDATARKVTLQWTDIGFALSCDYSFASGRSKIGAITLAHEDHRVLEALIDLNADGVYDVRLVMEKTRKTSCLSIFYEGKWQEVMGSERDPGMDKYHKRLLNGRRLSFDMGRGSWVPTEKEK